MAPWEILEVFGGTNVFLGQNSQSREGGYIPFARDKDGCVT